MLKKEGYKDSQIAEQMVISPRTVRRMLRVNPEYMCVDGTQTRKAKKLMDPYKEEIRELIERGFQNFQILDILTKKYPDVPFKRATLGDFCFSLREEMFDRKECSDERAQTLSETSILSPFVDIIHTMLIENKSITVIFAIIKNEGYVGSYSLLQQYCRAKKPSEYRVRKDTRKIKRRSLVTEIWSDKHGLIEQDILYIENAYPVFAEIKDIIREFRTAYSSKNTVAVKIWCDTYAQCKFPAICSFIKGIQTDPEAFYNSIKYEYSNGLLEGCVNKLKTIKRSMFGRAGYDLLRAKLLLSNNDWLLTT